MLLINCVLVGARMGRRWWRYRRGRTRSWYRAHGTAGIRDQLLPDTILVIIRIVKYLRLLSKILILGYDNNHIVIRV